MKIGEWYTNNSTGQLFEITAVGVGQIKAAPIEDIEGNKGEPIALTLDKIHTSYTPVPTNETIDDVLSAYAGYGYDQKFYRISFVGLACRIKRAPLRA